MAAHPDRSGESEDVEVGAAADLNRAKEILEHPEQRADCLLGLLGGPSKEQERGLPPDFLRDMLDLRESIESDEAADPEGAKRKWGAWGAERRREHERVIGECFARFGVAGASAPLSSVEMLRQIRLELNKWRYTERLLEQLDSGSTAM